MVNEEATLDRVFHALSDASRRDMVQRLISGPASVSELAAPLAMSLPAVLQHLDVLASCGLITTEKVGRVRTCRLEPTAIRNAEDWMAHQRQAWEHRLDRLGDLLAESPDLTNPTATATTRPATERSV